MASITLDPLYTAGLFDGEGWISFNRSANTRMRSGFQYYGTAGLRMREHDLVAALRDIYGGMLVERKPKAENHSVQYEWRVTGKALRAFLEELVPLLIAKKPQGELLLDYVRQVSPRGTPQTDEGRARQAALYDQMKQLNRRGVGK